MDNKGLNLWMMLEMRTLMCMAITRTDPVKQLHEQLPDDLYALFVDELGAAIHDVCAMVNKPNEVGPRVQALAEIIRSWHITLALRSNEEWTAAMEETVTPTAGDIGTIEQFRQLVAS